MTPIMAESQRAKKKCAALTSANVSPGLKGWVVEVIPVVVSENKRHWVI